MQKYFCFLLALVVFLTDRASKWWLLDIFDIEANSPVEILPFLNLTLVWNYGISLGLFQMEGNVGRYFLIVLTGIISLIIVYWLIRAKESVLKMGLGMVLGGAIGNIWDRFEYGAVADFLHFYVSDWSFYIFNIADAAITIGVIVLLWDALLLPQKKNT